MENSLEETRYNWDYTSGKVKPPNGIVSDNFNRLHRVLPYKKKMIHSQINLKPPFYFWRKTTYLLYFEENTYLLKYINFCWQICLSMKVLNNTIKFELGHTPEFRDNLKEKIDNFSLILIMSGTKAYIN